MYILLYKQKINNYYYYFFFSIKKIYLYLYYDKVFDNIFIKKISSFSLIELSI